MIEMCRNRLDHNWHWEEQRILHAVRFALAISWQNAAGGRHD
ncbi:hypothetical protein [Aeromonas veronii]|nr:hypothetical protein [Aeromonas veronii]